MAQEFKYPDDSPLTSASPSPSTSVSIEQESSDINPLSTSSTIIEDQVKKITESYLKKKNLDPSSIKKTMDDLAQELTKKNDKDLGDIEKKLKNAEDEIQNSKQRVTETLGIFVALFTFVSVSFQIFDKANRIIQIVCLELILVGSLVLFILLLHLLMRPMRERKDYGKSFLAYPFTKQVKIGIKALLWEKPLMLLLNNGTVALLLFFSFLLIMGGTIGFFIEAKEPYQTKIDESPNLETNNIFNIINEASSSAIKDQ